MKLVSLPDKLVVPVYLTLVFNPPPSSQALLHYQNQSTALSSALVFIELILKKNDKLGKGQGLK